MPAINTIRTVLIAVSVFCGALPARAQSYPSEPIKIIVSYSAGASAVDILARTIGQVFSKSMGVPVIVENRPGAGGSIGASMLAKAKPDGYTISVGYNAEYGSVLFFYKSVQYDPTKDFAPIGAAAEAPMAIAVNPSSGIGSTGELLAYIRSNPGRLSYGTAGVGTMGHLAGEMLIQMGGINFTHVPYKGTGGAIADVIGGQLPIVVGSVASLAPNHESGKLKILSVVEGNRSKRLPDVPTVGESALPGYAFPATWIGLFAPAGVPPPIIRRLNTEMLTALNDPTVRTALQGAGLQVTGTTPEKLAIMVKEDIEIFRKIATTAGIQPQ